VDIAEHGKTPLHLAAEHDRADLAEALIAAGADIEARTSWGATPLEWAGVLGSRAAGDVLIARGFFAGTALHWAAINGHADTVRFLLAAGADAKLRDAEFDADALGWAREGGHEPAVALLSGP
jgi:ankyrin repeat protein